MCDASKDSIKQLRLYADAMTVFATAQLLSFIYLIAKGAASQRTC
jgi:hypothetical protein